jgi:NAD(P)-dependent dehydrogenase (short-subunit alcohol dehydrogenase family)
MNGRIPQANRAGLRLRATRGGTRLSAMSETRVAVVTGANRGIGEEIASELLRRGLRVLGTSREPGKGGFVRLDVTRAEDIEALRRSLASGVDVLVNNAGASFDGFDAGVAERTLAVNFYGPMRLTDALLPAMRKGGRIVMVSSGMGRLSNLKGDLRARFEDERLDRAGLVALVKQFVSDVAAGTHEKNGWCSNAYSVSKIGLNALVRVLSRELASDPRGILVNSADPGWVRTRMGGSGAPRSVAQGAETPVRLALLPEGGPTGGFFANSGATSW